MSRRRYIMVDEADVAKFTATNPGSMNVINDLVIESSLVKGTATGGSATELEDTTKNITADLVKDKWLKVTVGGIEYVRKITSNTADTITIPAIKAAVAASAAYGPGSGAQITVVCVTAGTTGNAYTMKVVAAPGTDDNLSASVIDGVLNVFLGKAAGELSDAKNTGTLVAAAIDTLPDFTATVTGEDGAAIVVVTEADVAFTGGIDSIPIDAGDVYSILNI